MRNLIRNKLTLKRDGLTDLRFFCCSFFFPLRLSHSMCGHHSDLAEFMRGAKCGGEEPEFGDRKHKHLWTERPPLKKLLGDFNSVCMVSVANFFFTGKFPGGFPPPFIVSPFLSQFPSTAELAPLSVRAVQELTFPPNTSHVNSSNKQGRKEKKRKKEN